MIVECSQLSKEFPLWGSAPTGDRYWFVEIEGTWERNILSSPLLPEATLKGLQKVVRSGVQVLGIQVKKIENTRKAFELTIRSHGVDLFEMRLPKEEDFDYDEVVFSKTRVDQRQFFICVHGSRDQCCSKYGAQLMENATAGNFSWQPCSHIGGHRFAPTFIDSEFGLVWGRVDHNVLDSIVTKSDFPWQYLRGRMGLNPRYQVADVQMWKKYGWEWAKYLRTAEFREEGAGIALNSEMEDFYVEIKRNELMGLSGCGKEQSKLGWWEITG